MATYQNTSPWYITEQNSLYLDILKIRPVPADTRDTNYIIETKYKNRPDLLSYDLYGTPKLWWVFAQRNPDVIEDPIYDFTIGKTIQLPKLSNLKNDLGL